MRATRHSSTSVAAPSRITGRDMRLGGPFHVKTEAVGEVVLGRFNPADQLPLTLPAYPAAVKAKAFHCCRGGVPPVGCPVQVPVQQDGDVAPRQMSNSLGHLARWPLGLLPTRNFHGECLASPNVSFFAGMLGKCRKWCR